MLLVVNAAGRIILMPIQRLAAVAFRQFASISRAYRSILVIEARLLPFEISRLPSGQLAAANALRNTILLISALTDFVIAVMRGVLGNTIEWTDAVCLGQASCQRRVSGD